GYSANDRAFRERKVAFPICLDRYVVPDNGANIVEITRFVGHRDHLPVTISGGYFRDEDGRALFHSGSVIDRCARFVRGPVTVILRPRFLVCGDYGDCQGRGNYEDRKEAFSFHILVWFLLDG